MQGAGDLAAILYGQNLCLRGLENVTYCVCTLSLYVYTITAV